MDLEVGRARVAIIPSFKGMRVAVNQQMAGYGRIGGLGFTRAFSGVASLALKRAAKKAGAAATNATNVELDSMAKRVEKIDSLLAASSRKVSKLEEAERRAAAQRKIALKQLEEANTRYKAGSSQVLRAEERVAQARNRVEQATRDLTAAGNEWLDLSKKRAALVVKHSRLERLANQQALKGFDLVRSRLSLFNPMFAGFKQASGQAVSAVAAKFPILAQAAGRAGDSFRHVSTAAGSVQARFKSVFSGVSAQLHKAGAASGRFANSLIASVPGASAALRGLRAGFSVLPRVFAGAGSAVSNIAGGMRSSLSGAFLSAAVAADQAAERMKQSFTAATGIVAAATTALLASSLKGGFDRLASVETATAKMRGFGLEAGAVTQIMGQVTKSVQGTVYTVGDMGNAVASAVLAGVEPGAKLEKYMGLLKNTATAAGAPLNEIQTIFGKIVANVGGPVSVELNQLTDRGIPAWTILAQRMGKTTAEIKEMARSGQITSDVIVEYLGDAMAGMAEEVGATTTSSLQRLKSAFNRFGESLLTEAFPGVKAVSDAIRAGLDLVIALMPSIKQAFNFDSIGNAIGLIEGFTKKVNEFTSFLKSDTPAAQSAVSGIVDKVKDLAPLFGLAAAAAVPFLGSMLAQLPVVGGLFAGLGGGLVSGLLPVIAGGGILAMVGLNPETFSSVVSGLVSGLVNIVSTVLPALVNSLSSIVPALVTNIIENTPVVIQAFLDVFLQLADQIRQLLPGLLVALSDFIPAFVNSLLDMIPTLLDVAVELIIALCDGLIAALPELTVAAADIVVKVIDVLLASVPILLDGATKLFEGLVDGLLKVIPNVLTALINLAPQIHTTIFGYLPVILDAAINLFLGILKGLWEAMPQVIVALIEAIPQLVTTIAGALPQIIEAAISLFLGLITGLSDVLPLLIDSLIAAIPLIINALIAAVPKLVEAGGHLIQGLIDGIKRGADKVMEVIGNMINDAIGWAKELLGINSPSRVFRGIGSDLGDGFVLGIRARTKHAAKAAKDMAQAAVDSVAATEMPQLALTLSATRAGARPAFNNPGNSWESGRVVQNNTITMLDRDPRVFLRQLGRELEQAL